MYLKPDCFERKWPGAGGVAVGETARVDAARKLTNPVTSVQRE
jgi:hypothetical protein